MQTWKWSDLWLILLLIALNFLDLNAQSENQIGRDTMTLRDCVVYAIENNPELRKVKLDELAGEYLEKEVRASGLPQVNASGGYTDNFLLATQLLPGEIIGQPGTTVPVKFGVRYGLNAGIDVNQLLFSKSYFTGLKAAAASKGLYQLNTLKTKEDLIYDIAQLFLQLQITDQQKVILTANLDRVNQLIEITQAQFEEGIIKKVDVDQLKVNRTNLSTEIQNLDIGYTQQLSLLKYYMGMPVEQVLKIASMDSDEAKYHLSNQLNLDNNSTLRILQKQEELKNLELQNVKDGYFPTLSAFGSYSWQGQTNSLFSNESSFNSFGTGRWGLSLKVPIFDGFQKKYKAQQLEVAQLQLQHDIRNISNLNRMEFHNAMEKLQQSQTLIEQQVQNMRLAEELYGITKLSYQEGVAPLTELLNAETSLKEAQTQYLTATLQKKLAELDHLKTSGELTRMIESAAE